MFLIYSFLFMSVIYGYVEWRLISLLAAPTSVKILLSLILLPALFNLWVILFFGDSIPTWVSKVFATSQILLVYLFAATFFLDLYRLIHPVYNFIPNVVVICCILASVYASFNATLVPKVKEVELRTNLLSSEKPNLKIAQLSDFHIGQGFDGQWLDKTIEKTNSLKPDLIVITGDLIDNSPAVLGRDIKKLKKLNAPLGVYVVFGNHEYYHHPNEWKNFFKKIDLPVLKNENLTLSHHGQKITLAGIDFGMKYTDKKAELLLQETFKNSDQNTLRILLAHHPHVFKKTENYNIFLQLSGHTHGGMTFPVDMIVKLSNKGFLRGLYQNKNAYLYVSNGTGLWGGFPARIGTFNEITLITIKGE